MLRGNGWGSAENGNFMYYMSNCIIYCCFISLCKVLLNSAVRHNRVQNIPKICLNGLNGAILHRVPV